MSKYFIMNAWTVWKMYIRRIFNTCLTFIYILLFLYIFLSLCPSVVVFSPKLYCMNWKKIIYNAQGCIRSRKKSHSQALKVTTLVHSPNKLATTAFTRHSFTSNSPQQLWYGHATPRHKRSYPSTIHLLLLVYIGLYCYVSHTQPQQ